jgi:hypothetical protein
MNRPKFVRTERCHNLFEPALEKRQRLNDTLEYNTEIDIDNGITQSNRVLQFNCGGTHFAITEKYLKTNKFLSNMLVNPTITVLSETGNKIPFIDCDSRIMYAILQFYRDGVLQKPSNLPIDVWEKNLDYFQIKKQEKSYFATFVMSLVGIIVSDITKCLENVPINIKSQCFKILFYHHKNFISLMSTPELVNFYNILTSTCRTNLGLSVSNYNGVINSQICNNSQKKYLCIIENGMECLILFDHTYNVGTIYYSENPKMIELIKI